MTENQRKVAYEALVRQVRDVGMYILLNAEQLAPNTAEEYVRQDGFKLTAEFSADSIPLLHVKRDVLPINAAPNVEVRGL